MNLLRLLNTVKYLKPVQVYSRVWFRLYRPTPNLREAPGSRTVSGSWVVPVDKPKSLLSLWHFRFLNEEHECGFPAAWNREEWGKLWLYNLHYFDCLSAAGRREQQEELIAQWIADNPTGYGNGWEPYPLSLRIVNWIKWSLAGNKLSGEALQSLAIQVRYLRKRLEYHLLGNHLFANGKALVFAGLFFVGAEADSWLEKGLSILGREIPEQVLEDGGHFERSPMYHSMILEGCLDLLNVCMSQPHSDLKNLTGQLQKVCKKMVVFLKGMTHPDDRISLFNDAAFGIEAEPTDLIQYYKRITGESVSEDRDSVCLFPDTGYFVLKPTTGNRMLIDCGPIGPDYQPGHAHCDTLSFELSLKGRRVIVDSGCFQYEDGSIRQYNRGNAGHNTLTIAGRNQSEVWGAHRCARRARPVYAGLQKQPDGTLVFEGAHDGYRRLSGSPIHHRRISWSAEKCLVEDRVEGRGHYEIESRLHIHPSLSVDFTDKEVIIRDKSEVLAKISLPGNGRIEKAEGWYCPEFGIKKPCVVLTTIHNNVSLPFECGWILKIH